MKESKNHLSPSLTFKDSFLFPLNSPEGRREILIGGLAVMILPPIGWILNLGARLDVVHRLYKGDTPYFRGMQPIKNSLQRGCIAATTIFFYLLPANLCFAVVAWQVNYLKLDTTTFVAAILGGILFILAVFTLPGCMTVYACEKDIKVLRDPIKAFQRAWQHRNLYSKAWIIALCSIGISFVGLFFFIIGFFFTSVWAWEVVGYAFTVAMYNNLNKIEL